MSSPSILFRCDASREIGGGHVMRCLTLARALAMRGCDVRFACAVGSAEVVPALRASGFVCIDLEDPADPSEVEKAGSGYHAVVLDNYDLAQAYESRLRSLGQRIVVIDDLVDRTHDCDLLIDQNIGRSHHAYRHLIPASATALAGSAYAMVGRDFQVARQAALARHRSENDGRRVLVSFGLTDVGGISARMTSALLASNENLDVDVVVGATAQSRPHLEDMAARYPSLRVHVDTTRIAELMTQADLAIGAGGTTSWERCCLGLPTILLVLANNQVEVGQQLEAAGAAVCAANPDAAADIAKALLRSPSQRASMAASAAAIVDGSGVQRIVSRILERSGDDETPETFKAASIEEDHAEALWLWRNDPRTRAVSLNSAPIPWQAHLSWFRRTMMDADSSQFMVSRNGVDVGTVRFARLQEGGKALASINLDPGMRGRGFGHHVLACALERYDSLPSAAALVADIASDNLKAKAIFEACGFRAKAGCGNSRFQRYYRQSVDIRGRDDSLG